MKTTPASLIMDEGMSSTTSLARMISVTLKWASMS